MSVLHVITGLNVGGAETMLAKLVEHGMQSPLLQPRVLSLLPPGRLAGRIGRCGVTIDTLAMRQGRPSLAAVRQLRRVVRAATPTLLQGWMHHGNLAATLAARLAGRQVPVVWNIRHSLVDIAAEKPLSRAVLRLGRLLSATPDAIIYNSQVAAHQYEAFGFAPDNAVVIPNGFDCAQFCPRAGAGAALRARWGIDPGAVVVAMVARQHPMKDTATLVQAVWLARAEGHDLHLMLVGTGNEALPPALAHAVAALPSSRVTLLGERDDIHEWLSGVDIVALSSAWGEAFPNILGEAMASGVPCVATDVGDSAVIIGNHGRVVAPRNPAALAAGLCWLAGMGREGRERLGLAARDRIIGNYAIDRIADRYAGLYESVLLAHGLDMAAPADAGLPHHRAEAA